VEDALPGRPSPLGATPRDGGVNFAVASSVAEAAEVCVFDEAMLALRAQRSRAMLCTLLLSSGVPMLLGGDELGRT
jgi:glycogen operon protein